MKNLKLYKQYIANEDRFKVLMEILTNEKQSIINTLGINVESLDAIKNSENYKELVALENEQEKLCKKIRNTEYYKENAKIGDYFIDTVKSAIKE